MQCFLARDYLSAKAQSSQRGAKNMSILQTETKDQCFYSGLSVAHVAY